MKKIAILLLFINSCAINNNFNDHTWKEAGTQDYYYDVSYIDTTYINSCSIIESDRYFNIMVIEKLTGKAYRTEYFNPSTGRIIETDKDYISTLLALYNR